MLSTPEVFAMLDQTKVTYSFNGRTVLKLRNGDILGATYHNYKVILKYKNRQYTTYVNINPDSYPRGLSEKIFKNEIFSQYAAYIEERKSSTGINVRIPVLYPPQSYDKNTAGLQRLYGEREFKQMIPAFQRGFGESANLHPHVQSLPSYLKGV